MCPLEQIFPGARASAIPSVSPSLRPPSCPPRRRRGARSPAVRGVRLRRRRGGGGAAAGPARREEEEGAPWPRPGPASRRRSCGGCGGSAQVRTGPRPGSGGQRGPERRGGRAWAWAPRQPPQLHLPPIAPQRPISAPSPRPLHPHLCPSPQPLPPHLYLSSQPLHSHSYPSPHSPCPFIPLTLPSAPPSTLLSLPSAPAHLCPCPQLSRSIPAPNACAGPGEPLGPSHPAPSLHPQLLRQKSPKSRTLHLLAPRSLPNVPLMFPGSSLPACHLLLPRSSLYNLSLPARLAGTLP